ncbi:MAG: hypothetical protein IT245_05430 [Bacteroidia bacterium]|nr:hypothetical protein [Bacteroidia bacterium]
MNIERLEPLSESILALLIFEESFVNILSELPKEKESHVADELKQLMVKDFVRPCREIESDKRSGFLYDSDKLSLYSFTLTRKGIEYLEAIN